MSGTDGGERPAALPQATLRPARRVSLTWILPLAALALVAWLGWRVVAARGAAVTVTFEKGHGLEPGDEVRYRGIAVGEVEAVRLERDGERIEVDLLFDRDAERFAREGARFWIVRPQIGLAGVRGVETILGRRYVAALPGGGAGATRFTGLEEPEIVENAGPHDLEVILEAAERGNLDPGTQVTYREVRIGTVLSVGLALDARTVEARVHIEKPYVPLIRERSRFFFAGGVGAQIGTKLLWMEFEGNLARLGLGGSVAVATPEDGGEVVGTGHRFRLEEEAEPEWLDWSPAIPVGPAGVAALAAGVPLPSPLRARLLWKEGILRRDHAREGWLLHVKEGLLGPLDLLRAPSGAHAGTARLEAGGAALDLTTPIDLGNGLGLEPTAGEGSFAQAAAPPPDGPVDCVALGDPHGAPLALPAHRLAAAAGVWQIAESSGIDPRWHGAAVIELATGRLLGILVVAKERQWVALLPPLQTSAPAGEPPH